MTISTKLLATLPLLIADEASAQTDVWVDPIHGSNASSGHSAGYAWRTVAHALASTSAPTTVHLLPGEYGAASGETFPLVVQSGIRLVSTDGVEATRFVPYQAGLDRVVDLRVDARLEGIEILMSPQATLLEGVRFGAGGTAEPILRNVRIVGGGTGIDGYGSPAVFERCVLRGQSNDAVVFTAGGDLTLIDTSIESCGRNGVHTGVLYSAFGPVAVTLVRTSIVDAGDAGIVAGAWDVAALVDLRVVDSLVARSGAAGIATSQNSFVGTIGLRVEIEGSTGASSRTAAARPRRGVARRSWPAARASSIRQRGITVCARTRRASILARSPRPLWTTPASRV
ncbi:MAG: DUF1565 domain-containing protein, partial [Planctomycetota bacterium]